MSRTEAPVQDDVLVSVVIPTIGRPDLLRCVLSVLDQSVETEIIVVVDRPKEYLTVVELLRPYPVKVIRNQGKGAPAARNTGVRNASGTHVAFLDDDDYWLLGKLASQRALLNTSFKNQIVVCGTILHRANGKTDMDLRRKFRGKPENLGDFLLERKWPWIGNAQFCTSTLLMPIRLAIETPWDEDLPCCQDVDLYLRLAQAQNLKISQVRKPRTVLQQGSFGSIMSNRRPEDNLVFARKHRANHKERSWSDFLLTHVVMPYVISHDIEGARTAYKTEIKTLPHIGAILRTVAAWWIG